MDQMQRGITTDAQPIPPANDYVSPGLAIVVPDAAFPNMMVGDTSVPRWPWLRRWVEQNWYTDRRNPDAGFASRDEAAILYNNALLFRGKPCLEVGCWRGWSAVHLALGAGSLDIIDPVFGDPDFAESIRASCLAAGVLDRVRCHEGFSPGAIDQLSQATHTRWSFMFIDADHEGDAPRQDAEAAMRNAADTAMVMFHDLASPYVAAGLHAMRNAGWRTMVYQTMQIMGVAWRGAVEPVQHIPDPTVFWTLPRHLAGYEVSGWKRPALSPDGAWWPGMTMQDRRDAAMMRAQAAEDDRVAALEAMERQRVALCRERDQAIAQREQALLERDGARAEIARLLPIQAEMQGHAAATAAERDLARAEAARLPVAMTERDAAIGRAAAAELERDQLRHRAHAAERSVAELVAASGRQAVQLQQLGTLRQTALAVGAGQARENAAMLELARWLVGKRVLVGLLRRSPGERVATVTHQAEALGLYGLVTEPVAAWLCRRRMLVGLLRRSASFGEAIVGCGLLQAAQAWRGHVIGDMALRIARDGHGGDVP